MSKRVVKTKRIANRLAQAAVAKKSLYMEIEDPTAEGGVRYKNIDKDQRINLKGGEKFVTAEQAIAGPKDYERWNQQRALHGLSPKKAVKEVKERVDSAKGLLRQAESDLALGRALLLRGDNTPVNVPMRFTTNGEDDISDAASRQQALMSEALMSEALHEILTWGRTCGEFVLQKNECSRMHSMIDTLEKGVSIQVVKDNADMETAMDDTFKHLFRHVQTFVVKHDWCAAFGEAINEAEGEEYVLPFPTTAFEFKVSGKPCTLVVFDVLPGVAEKSAKQFEALTGEHQNPDEIRKHYLFIQAKNGVWAAYDAGAREDSDELLPFLLRQVKAISIMLDAEVAEATVVEQPAALNAKRLKMGRTPLKDYHVVDLSHRHKTTRTQGEPTGRKVRCHFRRGHWRHYQGERYLPNVRGTKKWVNWMLVGDPDLGFVDKEYRL